MKKLLFVLLAILIFAGVCTATRPEKDTHVKTIVEAIGKSSDTDIKANNTVYNVFISAVDNIIEIDDYFLFNIGIMKSEKREKKLSVGLLGTVFMLQKEFGAKLNK